jgi:hypothetical protein
MTSEALLSALHNEPFIPFEIRLLSGHAVEVRDPMCVAHAPGGTTAVIINHDDSLETIDLASVVSLEFEPPVETK